MSDFDIRNKLDIRNGGKGAIFIDDTSTHTGHWAEMYVVAAAVPAAITIGNMEGSSGLVGSTIAVGCNVRGKITKIRLTSGRVIAYKDGLS